MSYKEEKYIDSDGQSLLKTTFEGGVIWYINKQDKFHRLDGPAEIYPDGKEYWYKNGNWHRSDGPAVIKSNGEEEYYLEGRRVSKKEIDLIWLKNQVDK